MGFKSTMELTFARRSLSCSLLRPFGEDLQEIKTDPTLLFLLFIWLNLL